jgi:peptide-methionine (R)-S-oxide reductase
MNQTASILVFLVTINFYSCQNSNQQQTETKAIKTDTMQPNVTKTEVEWKKELTPEQYSVLREKGTERPFTSELNDKYDDGVYVCAACNTELFYSDNKFDGHCGWPSFDNEIGDGSRVKKIKDFSHGMARTEIICTNCNSHLGHIFDDGPTQTGNRYCVNGISLKFVPGKKKEEGK